VTTNKDYIFGIHAVESLLSNQPERIYRLCVAKDRQDNKLESLLKLANQVGVTIEHTNKQSLDRMVHNANHQGIVACCKTAETLSESDLEQLLTQLEEPAFLLILDGVQDPHNLGACFRSADAAGVHAIIAPKDKSVGLTATVSKVASGAAETIPFVQVTNLARTIEKLKEMGIWVYGAAGEADKTLYQTDLTGPIAIVLGAEGSGLRRLTRELCDGLIKIPMVGTVESLNVSVATGICLFEALRQRSHAIPSPAGGTKRQE
jgi:23S rRNA (guanosine2251-2'-O)-methyltransferase